MADILSTLEYSYLLAAGVFFVGSAVAASLREGGRSDSKRTVRDLGSDTP
jgi:hypothetical protein